MKAKGKKCHLNANTLDTNSAKDGEKISKKNQPGKPPGP